MWGDAKNVRKGDILFVRNSWFSCFYYLYQGFKRGIKPKKRWNLDKCTTGKVLRVIQDVTHHGGDESYTYSPLVEYSVEGVIYTSSSQVTPWKYGVWEYAKEGDICKVWYKSSSPEVFFVEPSDELYGRCKTNSFILKVFVPIYFLAFIFMMYGCAVLGADAFFSLFKMS